MNRKHTSPVRCAIYLRSATNYARPSSATEQEQACREAAKQFPTWTIVESCIFRDIRTSGLRTYDRPGLGSLLERAKERPTPFDYILITDTSRLGRNPSHVLQIIDVLAHHGIGIYFVEPKLDSRAPHFRMLLDVWMMPEEQYISSLPKKVRQGQHVRVLQGYAAGGKCYGYTSQPDFVRVSNGGLRRLGTKLRIVPSEAETVRTIYSLFADGQSVSEIVRRLNDDRVPRPEMPATRIAPNLWNPRLVAGILKRECYRGIVVWGRTMRLRHPATGRIVKTSKPEGDVVRVAAPELRIVDDELAARVDARPNSGDQPDDG